MKLIMIATIYVSLILGVTVFVLDNVNGQRLSQQIQELNLNGGGSSSSVESEEANSGGQGLWSPIDRRLDNGQSNGTEDLASSSLELVYNHNREPNLKNGSSSSDHHQSGESGGGHGLSSNEMTSGRSFPSIVKEDPLQDILPKVKFNCKGLKEGYYPDTDFNCEVFHYCKTNGFRFTFVCPPRQKFNSRRMTCDYETGSGPASLCVDQRTGHQSTTTTSKKPENTITTNGDDDNRNRKENVDNGSNEERKTTKADQVDKETETVTVSTISYKSSSTLSKSNQVEHGISLRGSEELGATSSQAPPTIIEPVEDYVDYSSHKWSSHYSSPKQSSPSTFPSSSSSSSSAAPSSSSSSSSSPSSSSPSSSSSSSASPSSDHKSSSYYLKEYSKYQRNKGGYIPGNNVWRPGLEVGGGSSSSQTEDRYQKKHKPLDLARLVTKGPSLISSSISVNTQDNSEGPNGFRPVGGERYQVRTNPNRNRHSSNSQGTTPTTESSSQNQPLYFTNNEESFKPIYKEIVIRNNSQGNESETMTQSVVSTSPLPPTNEPTKETQSESQPVGQEQQQPQQQQQSQHTPTSIQSNKNLEISPLSYGFNALESKNPQPIKNNGAFGSFGFHQTTNPKSNSLVDAYKALLEDRPVVVPTLVSPSISPSDFPDFGKLMSLNSKQFHPNSRPMHHSSDLSFLHHQHHHQSQPTHQRMPHFHSIPSRPKIGGSLTPKIPHSSSGTMFSLLKNQPQFMHSSSSLEDTSSKLPEYFFGLPKLNSNTNTQQFTKIAEQLSAASAGHMGYPFTSDLNSILPKKIDPNFGYRLPIGRKAPQSSTDALKLSWLGSKLRDVSRPSTGLLTMGSHKVPTYVDPPRNGNHHNLLKSGNSGGTSRIPILSSISRFFQSVRPPPRNPTTYGGGGGFGSLASHLPTNKRTSANEQLNSDMLALNSDLNLFQLPDFQMMSSTLKTSPQSAATPRPGGSSKWNLVKNAASILPSFRRTKPEKTQASHSLMSDPNLFYGNPMFEPSFFKRNGHRQKRNAPIGSKPMSMFYSYGLGEPNFREIPLVPSPYGVGSEYGAPPLALVNPTIHANYPQSEGEVNRFARHLKGRSLPFDSERIYDPYGGIEFSEEMTNFDPFGKFPNYREVKPSFKEPLQEFQPVSMNRPARRRPPVREKVPVKVDSDGRVSITLKRRPGQDTRYSNLERRPVFDDTPYLHGRQSDRVHFRNNNSQNNDRGPYLEKASFKPKKYHKEEETDQKRYNHKQNSVRYKNPAKFHSDNYEEGTRPIYKHKNDPKPVAPYERPHLQGSSEEEDLKPPQSSPDVHPKEQDVVKNRFKSYSNNRHQLVRERMKPPKASNVRQYSVYEDHNKGRYSKPIESSSWDSDSDRSTTMFLTTTTTTTQMPSTTSRRLPEHKLRKRPSMERPFRPMTQKPPYEYSKSSLPHEGYEHSTTTSKPSAFTSSTLTTTIFTSPSFKPSSGPPSRFMSYSSSPSESTSTTQSSYDNSQSKSTKSSLANLFKRPRPELRKPEFHKANYKYRSYSSSPTEQGSTSTTTTTTTTPRSETWTPTDSNSPMLAQSFSSTSPSTLSTTTWTPFTPSTVSTSTQNSRLTTTYGDRLKSRYRKPLNAIRTSVKASYSTTSYRDSLQSSKDKDKDKSVTPTAVTSIPSPTVSSPRNRFTHKTRVRYQGYTSSSTTSTTTPSTTSTTESLNLVSSPSMSTSTTAQSTTEYQQQPSSSSEPKWMSHLFSNHNHQRSNSNPGESSWDSPRSTSSPTISFFSESKAEDGRSKSEEEKSEKTAAANPSSSSESSSTHPSSSSSSSSMSTTSTPLEPPYKKVFSASFGGVLHSGQKTKSSSKPRTNYLSSYYGTTTGKPLSEESGVTFATENFDIQRNR